MRIEQDSLGEIQIPDEVWWGPQTERSRHNFTTGPLMPLPLIRALIQIKWAAAAVNAQEGVIKADIGEAIVRVCQQLTSLTDAELRQHFPLRVYQTGSGTQTNMNVNEVIAHLANGDRQSSQHHQPPVLPNDHVNAGQSSNDTFPTAMQMVAYSALTRTIAAIQSLNASLATLERRHQRTVKLGRTHLQDATPITFGQEVSGWRATLNADLTAITATQQTLLELPLGGTAVGTGLNTTPQITNQVIAQLAQRLETPFKNMTNKFHGLSAHTELTNAHATLKTLATDLLKIANDIRFLASGPRGGYGELSIPANEPGSSIMPGKINPTQAEALTMIATRVIGNDVTIGVANSQGNFEMNVYKPVIIATFLESADLLAGGIAQFDRLLVRGLTANEQAMRATVENSLMMVTALSPHIGYEASAAIAQAALREQTTLKAAALASGRVTEAQFEDWVDLLKMTTIE